MRNEGQIEFWNGDAGSNWARRTDAVDAMFEDLTTAILEAAGIASGHHVLDLGCGGGGIAIEAARRTGLLGSITAIDISEPLISVARSRAASANVNISFVMGDAAVYPFAAATYDVLVSRMGAMFFDDPRDVFRSLRKTLKPGGRVVLGVWQEPRKNPWAMAPISAVRQFVEIPPRPGPEDPGPFSFANPERVHSVFTFAGFVDTALLPFEYALRLGGSVEEALEYLLEIGPLAEPMRQASGDRRQQALDALIEVLSQHQDDEGRVHLDGAFWIVTATAP